MKTFKKYLPVVVLSLVMLVGALITFYPFISDFWNQQHQSRAITVYNQAVSVMTNEDYDAEIAKAVEYNEILRKHNDRFLWEQSGRLWEKYLETLDVAGNGSMGYVEVDKIGVRLPIYHGTDSNVLQVAAGHIYGSSLPVGGEGTHCAISGHTGLPRAMLFTDLTELNMGDLFEIKVLNKLMTYEVEAMDIVEPEDTSLLKIYDDKDYCTLITCTPYGVNSHRLLVRGHRIDNPVELQEEFDQEMANVNEVQVDWMLVIAFVGFVMLVFVMAVSFAIWKRKNKKIEEEGGC